jgi:hypothetical protein
MLVLILVALTCAIAPQGDSRAGAANNARSARESRPSSATEFIIRTFDDYPLVAIGERHGWQQLSDYIFSLIRDPGFSRKVNDIVVECGNSRYQELSDRYVSGMEVPRSDLQRIWRDVASPFSCDAQVYGQIFDEVRAVNARLPRVRQIRVLLGQGPLDWSRIKDESPYSQLGRGDVDYAGVIEREVLGKNRKALLIIGGGHIHQKRSLAAKAKDGPGSAPLLVELLDARHPRKLFTIMAYDGFGDPGVIEEFDRKLMSWPVPSIVRLNDSWVGSIDAATLLSVGVKKVVNGKISDEVVRVAEGVPLRDLADAFLYLGPRKSMTRSMPPESFFADTEYLKELSRRMMIEWGRPFDVDAVRKWNKKMHPEE